MEEECLSQKRVKWTQEKIQPDSVGCIFVRMILLVSGGAPELLALALVFMNAGVGGAGLARIVRRQGDLRHTVPKKFLACLSSILSLCPVVEHFIEGPPAVGGIIYFDGFDR